MMGLFDVIPSNFFTVLVSGNREIYADALMCLHQMFQYELNIRVDDFLASLISMLEDKAFVPEVDDEVTPGSLSLSGKARLILNRLIQTGWIDKEFLDGSFVEIITPRSYAISAMKLLSDLSQNAQREYNSLVFSTYSGLKQAKSEHESQLYEAVLSAKVNTEKLEYELRTLYHSIRSFLRLIQERNDVNDLLKNHFEEYKKLSDSIYHPIKTLDSVHRYMVPIQRILTELLGDDHLMHTMIIRAMQVKRYEEASEAESEILSAIQYVLDSYRQLGGIINDIDRKHSAYTKSSIEKIQYLMTADQTIKGKLVELLKAYANARPDTQEALGSLLERNIRVNRQEFIDGKSLYHKNVKSRRMDALPLSVEKEDAFSQSAMVGMMEQIKKGYSLARVRAFVEALFAQGKQEITSEELSLSADADFILLILAVIRAQEQGMSYAVQMQEGSIKQNGYRIPRMIIRKKGGKQNVE